jgi:hypothetical protein
MTRSTLSVVCVLAVTGCGGTTFVNQQYRGRLSAGSVRPVLLPVEAHRFPKGMRAGIEEILNGEVRTAFGAGALRVLPLKDQLAPAGFGNLSWRLALGMHHRAKDKKDPKLDGEYYEWLDELPEEAVKFVRWLRPALARADLPVSDRPELRYLVAGYAERLANLKTKTGGTRITFRVMVGLFDVRRARIVASTWKYLRCKPTLEAIRPLLTGLGEHVRKQFQPVYQ